MLDQSRRKVEDVPALYFVRPTEENIAKLLQDFRSDLYSAYYLNFASPIPEPFLGQLSVGAVMAQCADRVVQVSP